MKKLLMLSMMIMMILSLQGCSKTEYIYIKPKPYDFQIVEQPKVRDIRIYKNDIKLYKAYITNFRNIIDFHNKQIEDYEQSFEDLNTTK